MQTTQVKVDDCVSEFSSGVSSLEHYNLAVKMMFNYDTSNAQDILRTMEKEAVPAKMAAVQGEMLQWQNGYVVICRCCCH